MLRKQKCYVACFKTNYESERASMIVPAKVLTTELPTPEIIRR